MRRPNSDLPIKRLLIRSTNWIGDAIMTTPAVRAIGKNFPDARIAILAKPWVAPVFAQSPWVDEIIVYDGNGRHKGSAGKLQLAKELKAHKYDMAILLQNAFEAALLAWLARIPQRIGYQTDGRGLLLTQAIRCTRKLKSIHQIGYYLGILEGAGLQTDGMQLELFITAEERTRARTILASHGITDSDTIVGMNPGATYGTAKRWFPDRFARLGQRLYQEFGAKILIFGGPGEIQLGQYIQSMMGNYCINLCGKTGLRDVMALIESCDVFVTNDSGLMHVGAALNVPMLAIFGSTDHVTTAPYGVKSRIVREPTFCSPCLKPDCPTDHRCMRAITVDKVFDLASRMLRGV